MKKIENPSNPLGQDFTFLQLLRFTFPSVLMMLFTSTYTVIDGVFVSNLLGEDALATVILILPVSTLMMAISLMFATGGNAVIAKMMGEGKEREAKEFMTALFVIVTALSLLFTVLIFIFPHSILNLLKVSDELYGLATNYLLTTSFFTLPLFYTYLVQAFMVTAGKPEFGLVFTICGGLTNIVLDYLLISPEIANMGIAGAGIATGMGYGVPGILGFIYLLVVRKGTLFFVKPSCSLKLLATSMYNGMSELVTSSSTAITSVLFNLILMFLVGDMGVAAISAILYIQLFQNSLYLGFSLGVAPVIAYKYGENNRDGLKKVVKQSLSFISVASVCVVALTLVFRREAISIFLESSSNTYTMALEGLVLFSPAYLFMGYNVFFSSLFTSLSNGKTSAILSVLRSLVFLVVALFFLPSLFHLEGVWLAVPLAELLAIFVGIFYFKKYKSQYGYG